jgi:hypothetical protein
MYNACLYNATLFNVTPQQVTGFHYLFDGSYRTRSLTANRIVVVGQNSTGVPPQGEDEDSAEMALVGERLDMKPNSMATTSALAAQIAAAAMDKARLDGKDGFITLPPNCAVELYDVIRIRDSLCSQEATTFRVLGVRLVYEPSAPRPYYQQIILGAG